MRLTINGEERELADVSQPFTVTALIEALELATVRVAVELNRDIVRRANWDETLVNDGDTVEIVQFVGGGA